MTNSNPTTLERNDVIAAIRKSLRERSGKAWSVTGGRGTAWGWIRISAPPARLVEGWRMSDADMAELAKLLGKDSVSSQGESIPAAHDYRQEYLDRAAGRVPSAKGAPYWD